jgi:hypothetical protein
MEALTFWLPLVMMVAIVIVLFGIFLIVLRSRSRRNDLAASALTEVDRQAVWRKATADMLYATVFLMLAAAAGLWLWARIDNTWLFLPISTTMCFGHAAFNTFRAARQIELGWEKAQHTAWAHSIFARKNLPIKKTNQTSTEFGENGAVLK